MTLHYAYLRYLIIVLTLFIPNTPEAAPDYKLAECKKITVAGPDQWNPNSYFDTKSQRNKGLGYALFERIAETNKIPYQVLSNLPWQRVLKYAEDGQVDIIVVIYQSLQRSQYIEFSQPYFTDNIKIYVKKGHEFNFSTIKDLQGKNGLFPAGASYGDQFDSNANNLNLVGKTHINELFMYLIKETADYAIQESTRAGRFLSENKLEQQIVALPHTFLDVPVRLGFSRNSRCSNLVNKVKSGFQNIVQSGELAALQAQYTTHSPR